VDVSARGAAIHRLLTIPGDRLPLIGSLGEQPLAVVIKTDGRVLTRYQLPQEPMEIVGAAVDADGSTVVGEKGLFPKSTTWVGRLAADGAVVAAKEFPGHLADVARGSDGTTLVLIEIGADMVAKGLGPAQATKQLD
jgi:hypothetical protein